MHIFLTKDCTIDPDVIGMAQTADRARQRRMAAILVPLKAALCVAALLSASPAGTRWPSG